MKTSAKHTCRQVADLLETYGVKDVVVSPGTRNAPIIMVLSRHGAYRLHHCVDERSAAFRALGISVATGRPVALTCTSGTAMLNYGSAMAEAYYSRVPLIAITADRPARWIDQRDSQTIRQPGALAAYVRCCVDIADDSDPAWSSRLINDALQAATGQIPGPVHINLQLDAPLTEEADSDSCDRARKISIFRPDIDAGSIVRYVDSIICESNSRIMLLVGGMTPHEAAKLRPLLSCLRHTGIAIVPEIQSSLTDCATVTAGALEAALQKREIPDTLAPDVLITMGGSIVCAHIKAWLRRRSGLCHISAGFDDCNVDTYGALSHRVECTEADFLAALCQSAKAWDTEYSTRLQPAFAPPHIATIVAEAATAADAAIHISNGMSIRTMQGAPVGALPVWCNRGVSGIDGSTSTAMGAAVASDKRPVLLVTGDMSAAYDIGALAAPECPEGFTMMVIDNNGGDIFRHIQPTRALPERDLYLTAMPLFPLAELARAYGFKYIRTTDSELTAAVLSEAMTDCQKTIIHLLTDENTAK